MSKIKIEAAKALLNEKEYDAAKAVLRTIKNNPKVVEWLTQLEQLVPEAEESAPTVQWEYCQLYWKLKSHASLELESDEPDLSTAIAHYFALMQKTFQPAVGETWKYGIYDANSGSSQKATELITYSEEDAGLFDTSVGSIQNLREIFKQEQAEPPPYSFQYHLLADLRVYIDTVPETYIARLGLEGWQLIAVRDHEPWYWDEVGNRLRETLTGARLIYYFKRPISEST